MNQNNGFKTNGFYVLVNMLIIIGCFSCANIIAPSGGIKDEKGPKLIKSSPAQMSLNTKPKQITIQFNEKIMLNDKTNIYIQPSIENYKLKTGKQQIQLIIDSLSENTTYLIDFKNAITDITEKNKCDTCFLTFSTGEILDTTKLELTINTQDLREISSNLKLELLLDSSISYKKDKLSGTQEEFKALKSGKYHLFLKENEDTLVTKAVMLNKDTSISIYYPIEEKIQQPELYPLAYKKKALPYIKPLEYHDFKTYNNGYNWFKYTNSSTDSVKIDGKFYLVDSTLSLKNKAISIDTFISNDTLHYTYFNTLQLKEEQVLKNIKGYFGDTLRINVDTVSYEFDLNKVSLRGKTVLSFEADQIKVVLKKGDFVLLLTKSQNNLYLKPGEYDIYYFYDYNLDGYLSATPTQEIEYFIKYGKRLIVREGWDYDLTVKTSAR